MKIKTFKDSSEVAKGFADYLVNLIGQSKGIFTIALSGGSTPKLLFALLAQEPYSKKIDWSKVHLYWGDERCVAPNHADSNYKMTNEQLLSKVAIPTENIHRVFGESNPEEEAIRYSNEVKNGLHSSNNLPIFDLVMLGMGDDGHTLSIFPHQMELLESDKICEVATHPQSGQKRVTLTGTIANNAKTVAFLATGKNKAEKVFEILKQQKDWNKYPSSYINPSNGELYWFLDEDAAALI